jgi:molybdopterin-guanine dinucleotide biosynthesis protein
MPGEESIATQSRKRRFACQKIPNAIPLIEHLGPVDVMLVESYTTYPFPKLEVHRPSLGR